jgi:hypothetical protein
MTSTKDGMGMTVLLAVDDGRNHARALGVMAGTKWSRHLPYGEE